MPAIILDSLKKRFFQFFLNIYYVTGSLFGSKLGHISGSGSKCNVRVFLSTTLKTIMTVLRVKTPYS